jgi:hypothetical protein
VEEMDRLKSEIDYLEKKRARLSKDLKGKGKGSEKQGGFVKYLLILGLGFVAGNLVSKHTGLQEYLSREVSKITVFQGHVAPLPKQEDEGFFSIFNFGGDDEVVEGKDKKSWWNIF